jgi:hypothetical protein
VLDDAGWRPWLDFSSKELQDEIKRSHLRVEVWSNAQTSEVVVTFGGTVAKSLPDWKANLRWFFPIKDDEYTKLLKEVEPQFVQEFLALKQQQEYWFLNHATLYTTGHSPGAGLAEEFAYGLPIDSRVPRVTKVYAFDPTRVTAYTDIPKELRESNRKTLAIDRIFDVALESWYGVPQTPCIFAPKCGSALAVEHNGDVYSCDHYVVVLLP